MQSDSVSVSEDLDGLLQLTVSNHILFLLAHSLLNFSLLIHEPLLTTVVFYCIFLKWSPEASDDVTLLFILWDSGSK